MKVISFINLYKHAYIKTWKILSNLKFSGHFVSLKIKMMQKIIKKIIIYNVKFTTRKTFSLFIKPQASFGITFTLRVTRRLYFFLYFLGVKDDE